ncbi:MAG: glycosyltransferase [Anaerolineae bacterium]|nr:glycosyltransferase [Anaerolineae bacterium]
MHILYVTPYVPSHIRTRPYHLIRALVEQGHRVTLMAAAIDAREEEDAAPLRTWGVEADVFRVSKVRSARNCAGALLSGEPLQAAYAYHPGMAQRVRERLARGGIDVVHIEHLRAARMVEAVDGVPAVYDSVDCISLLFEQTVVRTPQWRSRLKARLDLGRTRRYEARLLTRFEQVVITSQRDQDALEALGELYLAHGLPRAPVTVITNGVDTTYFQLPTPHPPRDRKTIVFTGKMSYHANEAGALYFAREVLPRIWAGDPEVRFQIVGKDPTEVVQRLAEDTRIEVVGTVPDLRPYLAQATAAVCPVPYAVGVQFKVLEAMAMETPVISSAAAFSGMAHAVQGEDILVADTPEAFAALVLRTLADPGLAGKVAANGRQYVERHHSWAGSAEKLVSIYREVLGK